MSLSDLASLVSSVSGVSGLARVSFLSVGAEVGLDSERDLLTAKFEYAI